MPSPDSRPLPSEADGQPSPDALGDDLSGTPDDEDGVTLLSTLAAGRTDAVAKVNVQNAAAGALLDAWIDFNRDGSWAGPDEQIAHGLALDPGDNLLFVSPHGGLGRGRGLDAVARPILRITHRQP